jgi:sodium-dependent dicarboxylate transporter 2/3/5
MQVHMESEDASGAGAPRVSRARWVATLLTACTVAVATLCWIEDPLRSRALLIAGLYLTFALSEIVAPFVPTLFLLVATPLLLASFSPRYALRNVLAWSADPVLALFAGGLALGLAAQRHGVDASLASFVVRAAGRSRRALIGFVLAAAAFMSMWLSNVGAAALLLAALRPVLAAPAETRLRRSLLVALAVGANLGGMTTPIGSGPNAIAIAETSRLHPISFVTWMGFGVPIALGMCVLAYAWLVLRHRIGGSCELPSEAPAALTRRGRAVVLLLALTIAAWLTEPLHGFGASSVALVLVLLLFGSKLLTKSDLGSLDWSTLGLIAGGLTLGRLLENTGIVSLLAQALAAADVPRWVWLGALVGASAGLSAIMSNTATAAMLVPVALELDHSPSSAIIVAIATSFGMPFPISTPPNALVYGAGARTADLLEIGLGLMLIGCVLVTLSGSWFLGFLGF